MSNIIAMLKINVPHHLVINQKFSSGVQRLKGNSLKFHNQSRFKTQ